MATTLEFRSDPPQLPAIGMHLVWVPVGRVTLDCEGRPLFPAVPEAPGLYRFILKRGERMAAYIGEADNIRRRLQRHCRLDAPRDVRGRLDQRLLATLKAGGEISLAIITECSLLDPAGEERAAELSEKTVRAAVRQAALVLIDASDMALLER